MLFGRHTALQDLWAAGERCVVSFALTITNSGICFEHQEGNVQGLHGVSVAVPQASCGMPPGRRKRKIITCVMTLVSDNSATRALARGRRPDIARDPLASTEVMRRGHRSRLHTRRTGSDKTIFRRAAGEQDPRRGKGG
jgi:hypothetical protein